ncbi:MAG: pyruvate:ferredoxin (flavodoxin) oxidoreductase [Chloroflexi bacterium]|nr:pyruvate:ferredoxin (flavodoxin) oxidoreductase [Chloroflexota bacterium]
MGTRRMITIDGNEAAARIAYKTNEVIAIFPITPSSPMGEWADTWATQGERNIWGTVPTVQEMQSEAGAAGAIHGALQTGAMATTFTASQGLLLMIPNMYKIAGELTSTVFHVAARSLATHALSIFGDQSDVMATRATGFALLSSSSVQEVQDGALIAQAAALESRVPFLHFFDGFRTSHEVMKIEALTDDDVRAMIDEELVRAHRARGLSPDHPVLRGSAQNPDVYFQSREAANPYYAACPGIVQQVMNRFGQLTGRQYHLFEYAGAPDAERVIVVMGSGAETTQETVEYLLARDPGLRVGLLKVRLYRPFSPEHFIRALPASVRAIAVLDRTKEPGSAGEPLYLDVVGAVSEALAAGAAPFATFPRIIGGRYGLSSKEFTPAMVKAVFDELGKDRPRQHFTVGIVDDVTHLSLDVDQTFSTESSATVRALFYGLGSDGTVSANKNAIKIIGGETDQWAQGYFVYDSKKSGTLTVSHLRFGSEPIHSPYQISSASFVACHQFLFLERYDVLAAAEEGATFLLNSPFGPDAVWDKLPRRTQQQIIDKRLRFFVVDATSVASAVGLGERINTVMQACFFALSGVLPREDAIAAIKRAIRKSYGKQGETVVQRNFDAVDRSLEGLHEVVVPATVTSDLKPRLPVPAEAPPFVQMVTSKLIAGLGDELPVSAMPVDGTFPTGTARWEKRDLATEIPVWDPEICIQCGKCVLVCPHAAIREKVYEPSRLEGAPSTFKSDAARWREFAGWRYTLQVAPEDCNGCTLCIDACPAIHKVNLRKAIEMAAQAPLRTAERDNFAFFQQLPEVDRTRLHIAQVKDSQLLEPLFEFSGACAGCGETPYLKLLSQLFGERALIANATGCSSIYGGNLPTTPWSTNHAGRGPAWANSLFEDDAEFGLGFRLALDQQRETAEELLVRLADLIGDDLVGALLNADQSTESGLRAQRERVRLLKERLQAMETPDARRLFSVAGVLVERTVWIVGGDGWAYDIGYGGLDHVLASGHDVNVLVLDTEVYSNTGGQMSKATPRGAIAKFAAGGKRLPKKDLGAMAMIYGSVYVAQVAMGASDAQTVKAMVEAQSYRGPSLIIAYSHCIEHGYDLSQGLEQQRRAVATGYWPLYRYNPDLARAGKNPFTLDSKPPSAPLEDYVYNEQRYRMLLQRDEAAAKELLRLAQQDVAERWRRYERMAALSTPPEPPVRELVKTQ